MKALTVAPKSLDRKLYWPIPWKKTMFGLAGETSMFTMPENSEVFFPAACMRAF